MTTVWIVLLVAAGAAAAVWMAPALRARRRARLAAEPPGREWAAVLSRRLPLYDALPAPQRDRLHGLMHVFLAEKTLLGRGGLALTEEMRVTIAGHAALLLLGRAVGCYDELGTVIVYPGAFVAPTDTEDEAGVRTHEDRVLSGESSDLGQVVVSWEDVTGRGGDYNVLLHEFAHQLDGASGSVNGLPLLRDGAQSARWAAVFREAYDALVQAAEQGRETVVDPYGAESPAEFFAVCTEVFFEDPIALREEHAALFGVLSEFYGLDPAALAGAGRGARP